MYIYIAFRKSQGVPKKCIHTLNNGKLGIYCYLFNF